MREPQSRQRLIPRISLFCLAAIVIAAPFLAFVAQHPEAYTPHFRLFSVFNSREYLAASGLERASFLAGKFGHAGGILFWPGGIDGSDGFGGRSLLDPLTGLLFATGVLLSLWKWKEERHFVVLAGIFFGLMGSTLSIGAENRRTIGALPLIMLAAGFAADLFWGWLKAGLQSAGRAGRIALPAAASLALAFSAYVNTSYYFTGVVTRPPTVWVFGADMVRAIEYLKAFDQSTHVYFYSGRWSYKYETRRFLLPGMPGEDRSSEFGKFNLGRDRAGPVVYLFLPPYDRFVEEVKRMYPGGEFREERQGGQLLFSGYYLR